MDILSDKLLKTYTKLSRYQEVPIYYHTIDNKYLGGRTLWLKDSTACSNHEVVTGDTLDSLAFDYYNNPTYYWIIADFNRILDPFEELTVGDIIKIPVFALILYDD